MNPVFFGLGPITVHWYGVMMACGFLAGLLNWVYLGRGTRRDYQFCTDLLFWIMVAGVVGARVAYVLSDLGYFLSTPLAIIRLDQGGLIYYGGFLASGVAIVIFARLRHHGAMALVDFVITSVPLAHIFGRLGCLLNGCCYGKLYSGIFAVSYPARSLQWCHQYDMRLISPTAERSLPCHPVQLYEAALNLVIYLVMVWAYGRRKRDGQITALYLLTYPLGRFLLEYFRGTERILWWGTPVAQYVSAGLFVIGAGIFFATGRKEAGERPDSKGA